MTNIRHAVAGSCSFPTVQKSCQELLQKENRKRRPKIHYFSRLSNVSDSYAISPIAQATLELHFSVTGYGGLRLSFRAITKYLRGLVSVYERPIIAGVQLVMVYSSYLRASYLATVACTIGYTFGLV